MASVGHLRRMMKNWRPLETMLSSGDMWAREDATLLVRLLVLSWLIIAAALGITAWILDAVTIQGGTLGLLCVAAVFGLVNSFIRPVLERFSLPLTHATFGLFALVVNGGLFALTAGLTDYLDVGGFGSTVVATVLVSIFSAILQLALSRVLEPERVA
jgi:putative membrane protein